MHDTGGGSYSELELEPELKTDAFNKPVAVVRQKCIQTQTEVHRKIKAEEGNHEAHKATKMDEVLAEQMLQLDL